MNTSQWEGFPNTFLQAWARAIPTVSFFDTGSQWDGAAVVTTASNTEVMVHKVERLMSDDSAWQETGARCRKYYGTYHALPEVIPLYESLLLEHTRIA